MLQQTATLIDHVYFNKQCDDVCVQVRDVYYSDHDAVYCSVPLRLLWVMIVLSQSNTKELESGWKSIENF